MTDLISLKVGQEDMIALENLSQESLHDNLKLRYDNNLIYTFTGSILVSINPYQNLPIYQLSHCRKYHDKKLGEEPPHIFAIADAVFNQIKEYGKNQCVIISGESGAGKTEATKLILQFLSSRMQGRHTDIERKIIESSPILEAFGNAKTVRNNNSSRFGKFMEIHFDKSNGMCASKIQQYLLEKSRIISQAEGERNYHCFYYLCLGASKEEKTQLGLEGPENFFYLNQGTVVLDSTTDESQYFEKLQGSMSTIGFSPSEIKQTFQILAAILHIGQVKFQRASKGEGAAIENVAPVRKAAELLTVSPELLSTSLIQRINFIRNEKFTTPLTPDQSVGNRDALAKILYSRLFAWLVDRINKCIVRTASTKAFIGVLDIFGFENFTVNSFEQFCINWTNEAMQCSFAHHIFQLEQEEYEREEIDFSRINYTDNRDCINLIEAAVVSKTTFGLTKLLDDELKMPKATDMTFLEKVRSQHKDHPFYFHDKLAKKTFGVRHYAGIVEYDVDGFLDKNADTIQDELVGMLLDSSSTLIGAMFEKEKKDLAEAKGATPLSPSSTKSSNSLQSQSASLKKSGNYKITVATFFKRELRNLIDTLDSCHAHYVRCIKPNKLKSPSTWDSEMVLTQLAYSGMLDTIRIRKSGYPYRTTYEEFYSRYKCLQPNVHVVNKDFQTPVSKLLSIVQWDTEVFALGKTKIFLKEGQLEKLDVLRNEALTKIAIKVQAWWRGVSAQRSYQAKKKAVVVFQRYTRRFNARSDFLRVQAANLMAQTLARTWLARRQFQKSKTAIAMLQSVARTYLAQEELERLRQAEKERLEMLARLEEEERRRVEEERQQKLREEEERRLKEEEERRQREEEEQRREEEERRQKEEEDQKHQHEQYMQQLGMQDEMMVIGDQLGKGRKVVVRSSSRGLIEAPRDNLSRTNSTLQLPHLPDPNLNTIDSDENSLDKSNLPPPVLSDSISQLPPPSDSAPVLPLPDLDDFLGTSLAAPDIKTFDIMSLPAPVKSSGSQLDLSAKSEEGNSEGTPPDEPEEDPNNAKDALSLDELGNMVEEIRTENEKSRREIPTKSDSFFLMPMPSVAPTTEEEGPVQLRPYGGVIQNVWEDPPEVCMWEEHKNFSWKSYALNHLAKPKSAKIKMNLKDPWVHSTNRPEAGYFLERLPEHLQKMSDDIFYSVLSYMGDKKTKERPYDLAYSIIHKALTNPGLRDEVYVILMRQTTQNGNPASNQKGWELLSVVASVFPPSDETLRKTVGAHCLFNSSVDALKKSAPFCLQRMRRTIQNGTRRLPPSFREYERLIAMAPINIQIRFMDGRAVGFLIDSASNCAEAMEAIVHRIGLTNATGFGLYEVFNSIQKKFKEESLLADSISFAESLSKQHRHSIDHYLLFKKCAFTDVKLTFDDPVERELVFGQIRDNVLNDELPVSEEIAIALASLDLQVTVGDYSAEREFNETLLEQILPAARFAIYSVQEWAEKIRPAHQQQMGRAREDCIIDYIKFCQQLPLYGAEMFEGCSWGPNHPPPSNFSSFPKVFDVAINIDGMYFLSEERTILHNFKFSQLEEWAVQGANALTFKAGGHVFELTLQGLSPKMDIVLTDYQYFLQLESNWCRALKAQHVEFDDTFLRFEAGDIIWIKEKDVSGWWIGEFNGQVGNFPAESVEVLIGAEANETLELRTITQENFTETTLTKEEINASLRRLTKGTKITAQDIQKQMSSGGSFKTTSGASVSKEAGGLLGTLRSKLRKETPDSFDAQSRASRRASQRLSLGDTDLQIPDQSSVSVKEALGTLRLRQKDSTLRRKAVNLEGRVEFTKTPIKDSLLDLPTGLNKLAIVLFQNVLKYMGDYPAGKTTESRIVQEILQSVIENPELRDELYTQICKQVTNNPKQTSETRGFQLLNIVAGFCIPQDQNTLTFLHSIVLSVKNKSRGDIIANLAVGAENRLKDTLDNGPRRNPPTKAEYDSIITGSPFTVRVYFVDGTTTASYIQSQTTVGSVIQTLEAQSNYPQGWHNGLFQVDMDNNSVLPLVRNERLADYISDWQNSLKKASDNPDRHYRLLFQRQFVLDPKQDLLLSEKLTQAIFLQTVTDVRAGNIPFDYKNSLMLAALQVQVLFDEHAQLDPSRLDKQGLMPYIPRHIQSQANKEKSFAKDFSQVYGPLRSETGERCRAQYLTKCNNHPLYGATVFRVGAKVGKKSEKHLYFALSAKKAVLYHALTTDVYAEFPYIDIFQFGLIPNTDQFIIETGSLMNPEKWTLFGPEVNFIQDTLTFYKNAAEKN